MAPPSMCRFRARRLQLASCVSAFCFASAHLGGAGLDDDLELLGRPAGVAVAR